MAEVWQPIIVVADKPVVCDCGALAVFITLEEQVRPDGERDFDYSAWCQTCYEKEEGEA